MNEKGKKNRKKNEWKKQRKHKAAQATKKWRNVIVMDWGKQSGEHKTTQTAGGLCTGVNPPVSRLELAGELGPLLLMLPLQVADGERDALLTVGSQTAALRRGCGAGRRRQRAKTKVTVTDNILCNHNCTHIHTQGNFHLMDWPFKSQKIVKKDSYNFPEAVVSSNQDTKTPNIPF